MSDGELDLYASTDSAAHIQVRAIEGTVWLAQAHEAELFQTSSQVLTHLVTTTYRDEELSEEATCKEFLQVRREAARKIKRKVMRGENG